MDAEIARRRFDEAAHLFLRCKDIPAGIKQTALVAPFQNYDASRLTGLASLRFQGIVTTNYDRALHDAYDSLDFKPHTAEGANRAPLHVERNDGSMQSAMRWKGFFIARIHGNAENPDSIVLATEHFEQLEGDGAYHDFLAYILRNFDSLWVGFSFTDPAINGVLSSIATRVPKPMPGTHIALLPQGHETALRSRLAELNIEVVTYDPADDHQALWDLFQEVHRLERRPAPLAARDLHKGASTLTRFLASSYARLSVPGEILPLREVVIEGIVSQLIADAGVDFVTPSSLFERLRPLVPLPADQLRTSLDRALEGLVKAGLCILLEGHIGLAKPLPNRLSEALDQLVTRISARLKVREGQNISGTDLLILRQGLDEVFFLRGFDLGAHFAAGVQGELPFEGWSDIALVLGGCFESLSPSLAAAMTRANVDLLRHPSADEAAMLCDLGRVSFAVELVLNNSNQTANLAQAQPDALYLDASVLMPAITEGHPFSGPYNAAIGRAQSSTSGRVLSVYAARDFLNEIVYHRRSALTAVEELHLYDKDVLRRHLTIYGPTNTNVYVAAFAKFAGPQGKPQHFQEFLDRVAPFNSEDELEAFLIKRGIITVSLAPRNSDEELRIAKVRNQLLFAYEERGSGSLRPKAGVLVSHEARQLVRLAAERSAGRNPVFVTADRSLMRACSTGSLSLYGKFLISERGLIQLVDLLFGLATTDKKAMARLIWGVELGDDQERLRSYLIDSALRKYDDALTMASWKVIDEISKKAADTARREKISLRFKDPSDAAKTAKFLDDFEDEFYASMKEVIEREREES